MKTFVTLRSKDGPIEESELERIQRLAERTLAFRRMPFETRSWLSNDRRIAVLAWCNDTSHPQHREIVYGEDDLSMALAGYVFDPTLITEPALFESLRAAPDLRARIAVLPGVFALCWADGRAGTVRIWNGFTPVETVFYAENERLQVAGTRGVLVHLAASGEEWPRYDLARFGSFFTVGYFFADSCPYEGVKVLPLNAELVLADSLEVRSLDGLEDEIGRELEEGTERFYDSWPR